MEIVWLWQIMTAKQMDQLMDQLQWFKRHMRELRAHSNAPQLLASWVDPSHLRQSSGLASQQLTCASAAYLAVTFGNPLASQGVEPP